MEIGRIERRLSKKNQVVFPKKFRDEFGSTLIITKGFDKHLFLVSKGNIDLLLVNHNQSVFVGKQERAMRRFLLGNAREVRLDSTKRFVIPQYLRMFAGLKADIVLMRFGNHIEIWDKGAWDSQQEFLDLTAGNLVEEISERNQKNE